MLLSAIWAAAFPSAGEVLIRANVLVRASADEIGEVRLGKRLCRIVDSGQGNKTPTLIVMHLGGSSEAEMFAELRGALERLSVANSEVWVAWARGSDAVGALFPEGWIAAIVDAGEGFEVAGPRSDGMPSLSLFRAMAERFAGFGPVRIFWIDSHFAWLNGEGHDRYLVTLMEPFWPTVGDAGIALFPVYVPATNPHPESPWRIKSLSGDLFGTSVWASGGKPGDVLIEAIRDSEKWTALTLEIPRNYMNWRGLPHQLRVMDKSGKRVLFERPFVAEGKKAPQPPSVYGEMAQSVSRIVPYMRVRDASFVRSCGSRIASDAQGILRLEGMALPAQQERWAKVLLSKKTYRNQKERSLSTRGEPVMLERIGEETACLGPVDKGESDLFVYSPEGNWLSAFAIRKSPGEGNSQ